MGSEDIIYNNMRIYMLNGNGEYVLATYEVWKEQIYKRDVQAVEEILDL